MQIERFAELRRYGRERAEALGVGPEDSEALVDEMRSLAPLTPPVACDTNVLVSAFIAAGPPSRLLEEAIDTALELVLLQPVMVELGQILTGKVSFETEYWRGVEELLLELAIDLAPAPAAPPEAVTGDPR